jgi:hypothetical protein
VTLAELRAALEVLPSGTSLTLSRDALLDAVRDVTTPHATTEEPETWLTAEQAGAMLNVSPRWCYDHEKELGGKKLSRRCVRFSSRAVDRYVNRRHA